MLKMVISVIINAVPRYYVTHSQACNGCREELNMNKSNFSSKILSFDQQCLYNPSYLDYRMLCVCRN